MQQLIAKRYRVIDELGSGAMGAVYRVADTWAEDRELALKVIRQQGAITHELELRFREEFRAMVKLRHPNTIEVFDYGQLDRHSHYLTMELVTGSDLSTLSRSLPLEQVYSLLIQLLQALGFIHSRLFVHRDIKAENIRIRTDGVLKLMDFGLMDQLGLPASGKITGTPGYLPPEVAKGGVINASSDLYSVGCLAYELLTGRLPFDGDLLTLVRAHVHEPPAPLRQLRPELPERLEAIVSRLLEKDQSRRYAEASAVIDDLADLAGLSVVRANLEQKESYLTSINLVGRDQELAILQEALSDVMRGKGRAIWVGAPAGVGKSRLIQELILQAKLSDALVLGAQGLETGMAPYGALSMALRSAISYATPQQLDRHGRVLAKILPELAQQGYAPASLDPKEEKERLQETVVAWLAELSRHTPVVLHLDDLHWCDLQSLELLNACVRGLVGERVLMLGTARSDEVPSDSPILYTIEEGITQYLKLQPFDLVQVMLLLQATLKEVRIDKEFVQVLFDATAGNAFFLTETLRYLIEQGLLTFKEGIWTFPADALNLELPTSVEATVLRRLAQLSEKSRMVARIASVIGRYQDLDMLSAVSGHEAEGLFEQLEELVERQFLVHDEHRYTFPHDRVRQALYADTPVAERQEIHERCADYLETFDNCANTNELAYHFSRGKNASKAYEYLRKAGDLARASGQITAAIDFWQQASDRLETLDFSDRDVRQVSLWWDLLLVGMEIRPEESYRAGEKLLRILESEFDVDRVCAVLKVVVAGIRKLPAPIAEALIGTFSKPLVYRHRMRQGLGRLLPPHLPSWTQRILETYAVICGAYGFSGQPVKGLQAIQRCLHLLPFKDTPLEGAMHAASCASFFPAGRLDEQVASAVRVEALMVDRDLGGQETLLLARIAAGYQNCCAFQGIRPDVRHRDTSLLAAQQTGARNLHNPIWYVFAHWYACTGRWEEAAEVLEIMLQTSRTIGAPPYPRCLYLRAYLLWQRGEFEEAMTLARRALEYPHVRQDFLTYQTIRILKGTLHLALGEPTQAGEEFVAVEEVARDRQMLLLLIQVQLALGELHVAKGDMEAASRALGEAHALSASGPARNPLQQALAARCLGELALAQKDYPTARSCFKEALEIVERPEQDNLIEQGHLHRHLGELHMALEEPDEAHASFAKAADFFKRLQNRHQLRQVLPQLEALRPIASPWLPQEASVKIDGATRASHLEVCRVTVEDQEASVKIDGATRASHLEVCRDTVEDEDAPCSIILRFCLEALGADGAAVYLVPAHTQIASYAPQGKERPVNTDLLKRAGREARGIVALDMPPQLALGTGTNLEVEITSVLAVPVQVAGRIEAILYLVKHDLGAPFEEEQLEIAAQFGQLLSECWDAIASLAG